jgi:hypothetical protein
MENYKSCEIYTTIFIVVYLLKGINNIYRQFYNPYRYISNLHNRKTFQAMQLEFFILYDMVITNAEVPIMENIFTFFIQSEL